MRKIVCALAVCCSASVTAAQCVAANDPKSEPFPVDGEVIRVMGAGKHGATARPATLVSTAAAQPATRPARVDRAEAAPDKGDPGEHGGSQRGPMLLTALAVMVAIALRRSGASA